MTPVTRKPAAVRRAEILDAAAHEFGLAGLAGARLETIAARAGVSHPRIVQMFGSKRALFLEVVEDVFARVESTFAEAKASRLIALGDAYRRLLHRDRTTALVMLQAYAAAGDDEVRDAVSRRYRQLQRRIGELTGADTRQVRTFLATGFVITVSTALALPGRRADAAWAGWLLERVEGLHDG